MLDIKWIRENQQAFDRAMDARGAAQAAADIIELDNRRRATIAEAQALQEHRNSKSKEIGKALGLKNTELAEQLKTEVAAIKATVQAKEDEERQIEEAIRDALSIIPNLPLDEVPVGLDESANVEVRRHGNQRNFAFQPKEHFQIGEALGMMDFELAAKLSGSRFVVLSGGLARLERALGQFMLDLHTTEHGYEEIQPPLLVRDEAMFGTGQLPKFEDDLFRTSREAHSTESLRALLVKLRVDPGAREGFSSQFADAVRSGDFSFLEAAMDESPRTNLWLIPTAEVSLTNLVRDEILSEKQLPLHFTALTPCFRSEAGSAGRDTRGMLRQHQFNKVELVSITTDETSLDEHERMTACAEEVLKRLGLPFRTMVLSTGDMGFSARKTYDLEVWLPGQGAYREISSCSVCGDFQARRMNARYKIEGEKGTRFVHTLNGSGVAVGRALIAVIENYQNDDGSVTVPEALRPYMGGLDRITKN